MTRFGYAMLTEEHDPRDLVAHAQRAEEVGFEFLASSDHFHPWLPEHGHSPFVWSVLGAVADRTERIELSTMVTCPIRRYHPAIVAQAASTVAVMADGRFSLGVGAGERLNEHVVGGAWPSVDIRHEMLGEAIDVMRTLWEDGYHTHRGQYFELEDAQVFDRPATPPPVFVAVSGPESVGLAAEKGDGMIAIDPDPDLVSAFKDASGGKPVRGQVVICWGEDAEKAQAQAFETFRFALPGWKVMAELPNPVNFAAATELARQDDIDQLISSGPGPDQHIESINQFVEAGFDEVAVLQAGPDQDGFFRFWEDELHPQLG